MEHVPTSWVTRKRGYGLGLKTRKGVIDWVLSEAKEEDSTHPGLLQICNLFVGPTGDFVTLSI